MAVNRYENGKIYKLVNPDFPNKAYIGSTIEKYLCKVKTNMRTFIKLEPEKGHSYKEMLNGNEEIMLIEAVPCKSKDELRTRQQHYIDEYGDKCVNYKNKPVVAAKRALEREARATRSLERHDCEVCNISYKMGNKWAHMRTNKHISNLAKNNLSKTIRPDIKKTTIYFEYPGSKLEHYEPLQKPE